MTSLDLNMLEQEHLIGRLKVIELLERHSPFRESRDRVERRFSQALRMLPPELQQAALAIFGSTLYIPRQMLDDAWKNLWFELCHRLQAVPLLNDLLILELDRDLIRDDFYRANSLVGRLQDNLPWRSAHDLIDMLMQLEGGQPGKELVSSFTTLRQRHFWVLLIDLSMSGTSAASELSRLHQIRNLFFNKQEISIIALIQLATAEALNILDLGKFNYHCAIKVPMSGALNDPSYSLITDPSLQDDMRTLCRWFAETYILPTDHRLARISREASDPDIAAFGFGKRGWSIVTFKNTPNNSLPLLWFTPENHRYQAPFERIDSRTGATWSGRREWLSRVSDNAEMRKVIIEALDQKDSN